MTRRIAVAGGCGGIGRALVAALRSDGAQVAVLDQATVLEETDRAEATLSLAVEACDPGSVATCFEELQDAWGSLDGFVNLCGFLSDKQTVDRCPDALWHGDLEGNLTSAFYLARSSIPLLRGGISASVVLVSSGLGLHPLPGYGAYAAAKAGLLALARQLALELAPKIRVNAVAPGAVNTAFLSGGTGRGPRAAASQIDPAATAAGIPMGRIAEPSDVVGPIRFLLGPGSAFMTGQVLHVNGGRYMP